MLDQRAEFLATLAEAHTALELAESQRPKRLSRLMEEAIVKLAQLVERLRLG